MATAGIAWVDARVRRGTSTLVISCGVRVQPETTFLTILKVSSYLEKLISAINKKHSKSNDASYPRSDPSLSLFIHIAPTCSFMRSLRFVVVVC
jgi:hypothetical protein